MSGGRGTVELTLRRHPERDTLSSYCVSEGDPDEVIFLPKSRVDEPERASRTDPDIWVFEVPEWLAEREGLV